MGTRDRGKTLGKEWKNNLSLRKDTCGRHIIP